MHFLKHKSLYFIILSIFLFSFQNSYADTLSARAALIKNSETNKILYAKNPYLKLPPASTTKLVTSMVTLDKLSTKHIAKISRNAASTPYSKIALKPNERISIKNLLELALVKSVNSAAVALAEEVAGSEKAFVKLMNRKVKSLGALNTKFINASGLPGKRQYTTVHDLTKIMEKALEYPTIKKIIHTKTKKIVTAGGRKIYLKNTNKLLWRDQDLLGGKTGYTRAARHCITFAAEKDNQTLVAAVLGEPRRNQLWHDSKKLLSKGYNIMANNLEPVIYVSSYKRGKSKSKSKSKVKMARKASKKKRVIGATKKQHPTARVAKKVYKSNKLKKHVRVASKKNYGDQYRVKSR